MVSPKDSERFHFKLILNVAKGAKSFEDLKTFENRISYIVYRIYIYKNVILSVCLNVCYSITQKLLNHSCSNFQGLFLQHSKQI